MQCRCLSRGNLQAPQAPDNINIRGLGSTPAFSNPGLEYGVGVYVDQVYFARPGQSTFDLFDIQQIEVLRGSGSTLYGSEAVGGVVNVVTSPVNWIERDASRKEEIA